MNTPSTAQLMDKVDAKYTLVIVTAKRARQLMEASLKEGNTQHFNPVSAALNDIAEGKVKWSKAKKNQ
ncbi:MAG: DNA-directed RNA polymerase subunit omega [Clostridia bacterium]|nr:DNA-directed RNA polymerase subunit omega [Clostridia bacterium]MDD4798076.1 DNA-directed RNA polymerase subunit omega [Clostridia bacterium]